MCISRLSIIYTTEMVRSCIKSSINLPLLWLCGLPQSLLLAFKSPAITDLGLNNDLRLLCSILSDGGKYTFDIVTWPPSLVFTLITIRFLRMIYDMLHAYVSHCCKGDAASQWETAMLAVPELRNHWTDRLKIWHTWLRRWADLVCQIS